MAKAAVGPQGWLDSRGAAAGIYGTIICASVMAAAAAHEPVPQVAARVVGTLVVFWLAERYAEVLAARMRGDHLNRQQVRRVVARGWPMVQASYTPLIVLLVSWLLGGTTPRSVNLSLGYTIALLFGLGWLASTRAGLTRWGRIWSTLFAGGLGMALVLFKIALH